jgi:hypothetical protein
MASGRGVGGEGEFLRATCRNGTQDFLAQLRGLQVAPASARPSEYLGACDRAEAGNAMSDSSSIEPDPKQQESDRRAPWALASNIAKFCLLLAELILQPIIFLAFVSFRLMVTHFMLGYWLNRVDPDRPRAAVFFWIYVGTGLFNTSLFNCLFLVIVCVVKMALSDSLFDDLPFLLAVLTIFLLFFWLFVFSALRGYWLAWRYGLCIWIGDTLSLPYQADWHFDRENDAEKVYDLATLAACILPTLSARFLSLLLIWLKLVEPEATYALVALGGLTIAPGLLLRRRIRRTVLGPIIAVTPSESWGTGVIGSIMTQKASRLEKKRLLAKIPPEYWKDERLR